MPFLNLAKMQMRFHLRIGIFSVKNDFSLFHILNYNLASEDFQYSEKNISIWVWNDIRVNCIVIMCM